jgi:hypothetical protein
LALAVFEGKVDQVLVMPTWFTRDHVSGMGGMGLSLHPDGGYDKKTQAGDIARVLDPPPHQPVSRQAVGVMRVVWLEVSSGTLQITSFADRRRT